MKEMTKVCGELIKLDKLINSKQSKFAVELTTMLNEKTGNQHPIVINWQHGYKLDIEYTEKSLSFRTIATIYNNHLDIVVAELKEEEHFKISKFEINHSSGNIKETEVYELNKLILLGEIGSMLHNNDDFFQKIEECNHIIAKLSLRMTELKAEKTRLHKIIKKEKRDHVRSLINSDVIFVNHKNKSFKITKVMPVMVEFKKANNQGDFVFNERMKKSEMINMIINEKYKLDRVSKIEMILNH